MATAEVSVRWYRYAIGDLATARVIVSDERLPSREAAYLAQQSAEKALKATIALDGTEPPWTHDLPYLALKAPSAVRTALVGIDLRPLWAAGSAARYPDGDDPAYDDDELTRLLDDAAAIVDVVRTFLHDSGLDVAAIEPL